MSLPPLTPGALDGTRGRIVDLLRRSPLTANDIAARLGVTHNAVRVQLAALQRDGLVREGGLQSSATRPAVVYELAPTAELVLSRAYIPFVAQLVRVLGEQLPSEQLEEVMRAAGRRLAAEWPPLRGDLRQRVSGAAALLEELGAPNDVEPSGTGLVIRGYGCALAAAVHGRPEVCRALESLLGELIHAPVRACCDHGEDGARPRCCFQVALAEDGGTSDERRARSDE
ncbi:MAG TPA: helix-turn-helix domain-containing protein [Gemmatimonadaceae bacterium]|nr:helix-turn-helix domain-containing protein [Gemmatimonadaceae bacterium]